MVGELESHLKSLISAVPALPQHLSALPINEVLERFESDKKHKQDSYVLILVEPSGAVVLKKVAKTPESKARIERAIRSVVEGYRL